MSNYDPKFEKLKEILEGKRILENKKIMIFSTFRLTLQYLYKKLKRAGFKVGMIHGGVKDSDRITLRNRFESNSEDENSLDVMLFSEIGCEGLDFQFCDTMVNYDLPWNPMSIEQRIGRIDRRGQKSKL